MVVRTVPAEPESDLTESGDTEVQAVERNGDQIFERGTPWSYRRKDRKDKPFEVCFSNCMLVSHMHDSCLRLK